jgi:hypothetical protein
MAKAAKEPKKEIYGLFDGQAIVDIGSRDSLYALLPYVGPTGEIVSLDNMCPSALRKLRAEIQFRNLFLKMTSI